MEGLAGGLFLVALLAFMAWVSGAATVGGALTGGILALLAFLGLGFSGVALLACFVVVASVATRVGYQRKLAAGIAQEQDGQRGARHALANCGVAVGAGLMAGHTAESEVFHAVFTVAFAAALATALADSLASELGQVWAGKTWTLAGFEEVAPGTDGGVSVAGTVAAGLGAGCMAALGWWLSLYSVASAVLVAVCGLVGCLADSVIGATLERRGWIGNEAVNLIATATGALLAAVLFRAI